MNFKLVIYLFAGLLFFTDCFSSEYKVLFVVDDLSDQSHLKSLSENLEMEVKSIFEGTGFDVAIEYFDGNNNIEKIKDAVENFQKSKNIDIAITLGFISNEVVFTNFSNSKKPIIIGGSNEVFHDLTSMHLNKISVINLDYDLSRDIKKFADLIKGKNFVIALDDSLKKNDFFKNNANFICKLNNFSCEFFDKDRILRETNNLKANFDGVFFMPFQNKKIIEKTKANILNVGLPLFSSFYDESENICIGSSFLKDNSKAFLRRIALNVYDFIVERKPIEELEKKFIGASSLKLNPNAAEKLNIDLGRAISLGFELGKRVKFFEKLSSNDEEMNFSRLIELVLNNNYEIKKSSNSFDSKLSDVDLSKSELLPQLSASFEGSKSSLPEEFFLRDGYSFKLKAHQNLFDDKKISKFRFDKEAVNSAKADQDIVKLNIIKNAYFAYIDVLIAKANVIALEENLRFSQKALNDAKNLVKIGSSRKTDVFRLESELSRVKSDLNLAYSIEKESFSALNSIIDFDSHRRYKVEDVAKDKSILNLHTNIFDLKNNKEDNQMKFFNYCLEYAINYLPDISKQKSEINAQKVLYSAAKRERFMPKIGINAEFGKILFEDESSAIVNSVGDNYVTAGIDLSLPIFAGGRISGQIKKHASDLKIAENDQMILKRDIAEHVSNILNLIKAHYENFKFSKISYTSADKNFHLIAKSYAKGEVSAVDLIDAKNTLISNKIFMLNQLYSFYKDYCELQRILGLYDIDMLVGFLECFLKDC